MAHEISLSVGGLLSGRRQQTPDKLRWGGRVRHSQPAETLFSRVQFRPVSRESRRPAGQCQRTVAAWLSLRGSATDGGESLSAAHQSAPPKAALGEGDSWRSVTRLGTITRQAEDRQKASRIADGLMKLATVGNTKGVIARGLTADGSAHYALSSNDQTLPWLYGMWRYLRSDIPDEVQRQKVTAEIIEVVEALHSHGWCVPSDRAPFDYFGAFGDFGWNGAPRLLFLLKMAANVSRDEKWEKLYHQAIVEKAPSGRASRLETCRKGMVSARKTYHT